MYCLHAGHHRNGCTCPHHTTASAVQRGAAGPCGQRTLWASNRCCKVSARPPLVAVRQSWHGASFRGRRTTPTPPCIFRPTRHSAFQSPLASGASMYRATLRRLSPAIRLARRGWLGSTHHRRGRGRSLWGRGFAPRMAGFFTLPRFYCGLKPYPAASIPRLPIPPPHSCYGMLSSPRMAYGTCAATAPIAQAFHTTVVDRPVRATVGSITETIITDLTPKVNTQRHKTALTHRTTPQYNKQCETNKEGC